MNYYITVRSFQLDPRYLVNYSKIDLGDGIDLEDPRSPAKTTYSVFKPKGKEVAGTKDIESQSIIDETIVIKESSTVEEESNTIRQYFKASYGLSSVGESFERAKKELEEYHTIYALLEHAGEAESLKPTEINWGKHNPEREMVGDPKRDLELFLARYGSHYVSAIKYGLKIGIQAKLRKSEKAESTALSVDFKTAFGSVSAGGGARVESTKNLRKMGVEVLFEATSGGQTGPGLNTARDIDAINKFLDDLGNGKIVFKVAPIQITLAPYWPTLRGEWKKVRAVLDPTDRKNEVLPANYGVPKGTIIPWNPPGEYLKGLEGLEDKSRELKIMPPDGWAICDGQNGTPNLRDYFIRGTDKVNNICKSGGAVNHNHGGKTERPSGTLRIPGGGKAHDMPVAHHTHGISEVDHLPPFIWLVYIMKM